MAKTEYFYQCILEYQSNEGSYCLTTWVPEKYARLNIRLELKDKPDIIWTVTHIGNKQTGDWVNYRQVAHRKWRNHTDV